MKRITVLLIAALAFKSIVAQDKIINDANAEARQVSGFHAINISTGIELIVKQGSTEAVAVSAAVKEDRDNIKTEVADGVLKIYFDTKWYKDWSSRGKKLKAYVSFKQIDMLHGSSGASTTVDGNINGDNMKIALSSGAVFKGALELNSLRVDNGSGGVANISGKVQTLSLEASSGAVIHSYDLLSDKCAARASSGGLIQVNVSKELSARASSGGDIRYKGNGIVNSSSASSGGSIKKA